MGGTADRGGGGGGRRVRSPPERPQRSGSSAIDERSKRARSLPPPPRPRLTTKLPKPRPSPRHICANLSRPFSIPLTRGAVAHGNWFQSERMQSLAGAHGFSGAQTALFLDYCARLQRNPRKPIQINIKKRNSRNIPTAARVQALELRAGEGCLIA